MLLSSLFASCVDDACEDVVLSSEFDSQGVEVKFTYTVGAADGMSLTSTRSLLESTILPDGERLGIYAITERYSFDDGVYIVSGERSDKYTSNIWHGDNLRTNFKNSCYEVATVKYNIGSIEFERQQLLPVGASGAFPSGADGALRFFAYYPYTTDVIYDGYANYPLPPSIPIMITPQLEDNQDYLYSGPINAYAAKGIVNIPLRHALGRLNIYVTCDKSLTQYFADWCPLLDSIMVTTTANQVGRMNIETGDVYTDPQVYPTYTKFTRRFSPGIQLTPYLTATNPAASYLIIPSVYGRAVKQIELFITDTNGKKKTYTVQTPDNVLHIARGCVSNITINYSDKD